MGKEEIEKKIKKVKEDSSGTNDKKKGNKNQDRVHQGDNHTGHTTLTTADKKKKATTRDTIEKLKDAISCRLDFLWAHLLGLEAFTGFKCTFCHDENTAGRTAYCPIRDNDDKHKAKTIKI